MRSARGALSPGRASRHVPAAPPLYAPAGSRDGQIVRLRTLRLNEFLRSSQRHWAPSRLRRNPHSAPSVRQHEAPLGSFDHLVANVATADAAGAWHSGEPDNATVQGERDAHPLAVLVADLELSEHQPQSIVDRDRQGTKSTAVTTGSIELMLMAPRGNTAPKHGMQRATAWGQQEPFRMRRVERRLWVASRPPNRYQA